MIAEEIVVKKEETHNYYSGDFSPETGRFYECIIEAQSYNDAIKIAEQSIGLNNFIPTDV
ncbi:hypothetical protein [Parafilimonas terrae]|uniref:hypothetical protein n=1 Tax=Parafilimonas terrae TaxID=1465490 RepID=UPI000B8449D6|nr:hypothetical protein [Parafilimonas terrae]